MDNIVGRLQRTFSQAQIDLLIGSLLGDARLECRSRGVKFPVSARLRIHQSDKQKEYVLWKYSLLKKLVPKEPRKVKAWRDPKRQKDHFSWYFHTKTLTELGELYHYFYKNKIKILPESVFEFITPRALAIWFMDDGSNTGSGLTISTHCFVMADQKRIVAFLKEKHGVTASIIKDRDRFKIGIGKHAAENFIEIVRRFIIPSMEYKICNPRNDFAEQSAGVKKYDVITS